MYIIPWITMLYSVRPYSADKASVWESQHNDFRALIIGDARFLGFTTYPFLAYEGRRCYIYF